MADLQAILKQAVDQVDLGAVTFKHVPSESDWRDPVNKLTHGQQSVVLTLPDEEDSQSMAQGLQLEHLGGRYGMDLEDMEDVTPLAHAALNLMREFNAAITDLIQVAKDKEQREEEEREAARKREAEQLEERKERLLSEFLEEHGRIRLRGYKRLRPVTVKARQRGGDDEFLPYFEYKYSDKHGYHPEWMSSRVVAFHIKVGKRYQSVWDDGQEDLSQWDRSSKLDAPESYDGAAEPL